jgi:putative ABC transport system substrate-binding protein
MDYPSIGRAGVQVSALCLLCLLFGGPTDEADPIWLLDRALDTDINFLDTASIDQRGRSEEMVGTALKLTGQLAATHSLPSMDALKECVEVGDLMADGPSMPALDRRAASSVDKLLKGTKPSDLHVEQPTTVALVCHLKTAQALGLTLSPRPPFHPEEVLQ